MNIVITQAGPVTVPKEVYDKISARTDTDSEYGSMILFMLSVPAKFNSSLSRGIPSVQTYEDFAEKFLPTGKCVKCGHPYGGTGKRNIIV